jgi:predicted TIM-barrel fold metal-dependent hydrolase
MIDIKRNIEPVAALPLPPGAVEKILGGNAAGLLGLNSQASNAVTATPNR